MTLEIFTHTHNFFFLLLYFIHCPLARFIILINLCLDVFYQLDAQINTMMYKSDKAWHCSVCEKTSLGKSNISRHIEATHLENHPGLNCDICGETAKSRNALRVHIAAKHR